ncbi:S8 family serine peptidase [uncultured Stenotrophomonas sp.]|uniref:S8 family serine peptidase n=1 Tax=uncultured Stenotrophomonas sp. TaxID=165438 RepID=UPI0025D02900|nr:S8 family serine peptidase [uncultured Stenotrophomonas sp.]
MTYTHAPLRRLNRLAIATALILSTSISVANAQDAGDPLAVYQWHLKNTGQRAIADTPLVSGNDLNVDGLYRNNIRGEGVTIGIIDNGLQIAHPDLRAHVGRIAGRNFNPNARNRNDPTPLNPTLNAHGTMVGGIAAAVGGNGIGVRGVAPSATLKGFNWLESKPTKSGSITLYASEENLSYAWWDGQESADIDVFNNSWGLSSVSPNLPVGSSTNDQLSYERAMSSTRSGRGGIYVKAAGNNFTNAATRKTAFGVLDSCSYQTKQLNVGCLPAGHDPRNNYFNTITVGAVAADGRRSSYSSTGSALWVSGFGGEGGIQKKYEPGLAPNSYDPAIITTDIAGCEDGTNINKNREDDLDSNLSLIDRSCDYTAKMNGTSAAAPMVSGVAALILEANPQLSFRDVKYVLAVTARKTDPQQVSTRLSDGRELVPGWITNAAGHAFSNWYGFGVVDAARAVHLASTFQPLGALVDTGWHTVRRQVSISSVPRTTRLKIEMPDGARKIEAVQLGFSLDHVNSRLVEFVLISPSGTRSVVQPAYTAIGSGFWNKQASFSAWQLLSSNAFLDENGKGTWTLEATDMGRPAGAASRGKLESFTLRILGH